MIAIHLLVYTVHAKIIRTVILVLVSRDTLAQTVVQVNSLKFTNMSYDYWCFSDTQRVYPVG